jgi:hypothetical protein
MKKEDIKESLSNEKSAASMARYKAMADHFDDLLDKDLDRMPSIFDLMVVEQMEKDIKALEQSEELRKNGFNDEVKENIMKSWGNSIELPK